MSEELKPCPKCGKQPSVMRPGSFWKLVCANHSLHPVSGHTMKTKREAIAAWNSRATPQESPE